MTELESCVLGVVWLRGPCTAYVVRREFQVSESSHWSGSGGAIYPVLKRLEKEKLIHARTSAWGTGKKKAFEITPRGLEALREWIGPPLPQWTAAPTFDPVRTRLSFLGALPAAKRARFVAEAQENLDKEIAIVRDKLAVFDREADPFEYLVFAGTLHELVARSTWLAEVARELDGQRRKSASKSPRGIGRVNKNP
jgi:DNA-binding PadR family transcriptional regulator